MKTILNEEVENFFSLYKLEDINIQNIKKHFNNIHKENEYGNLLHAAIHNKYPEDKTLKFIKVLLENGINPNFKGEVTGYSFIHLALYGYTEKDKEYSYSTEFIIKLINLAKKYEFNVNIQDYDDDSLIHTALASEIYSGSIVALIEALGNDYDLCIKDNNDNDIYKALLKYKKEAQDSKNENWYNKLCSEEEKIKLIVEKCKNNLDSINKDLISLKNKLEELMQKTDINFIFDNYNFIAEIHKKIDFLITKKENISEKKGQEDLKVWNNYNNHLNKIINCYIETELINPDQKKIDKIIEIASILGFIDIKNTLIERKDKFNFKSNISKAQTLGEIKEIETELNTFNEKNIKEEITSILIAKKEEFENQIVKINQQYNILNLISSFLEEENSTKKTEAIKKEKDFTKLTLKELIELNQNLKNTISENKSILKQSVIMKIDNLFKFIDSLERSHIFNDNELSSIYNKKVTNHKNHQKKKKR